jgi:RimJ/RimL family protein N-acetyltransferase
LIGSTGLAFETPYRAATGYILTPRMWGQGYATEALRAIVQLAPSLGVRRLHAICHTEHPASARVLEKCGFSLEGRLRRHTHFPTLPQNEPSDVFSYARIF